MKHPISKPPLVDLGVFGILTLTKIGEHP